MKKILIGILVLGSFSSFACQYGISSGTDAIVAIEEQYPTSVNIEVIEMNDITISLESIFKDCPESYRFKGNIEFKLDDKMCSGKVILKYKNNNLSKSKIKKVRCK